jgi:gluconokinase
MTTTPSIALVMGVAGSGKTTIGAMLAGRLGWEYAEADSFHPPANVEKMHAGIPLTDEDRWPWLEKIGEWIDSRIEDGMPAVVTCSALKRKYRDFLRAGRSSAVALVFLDGSRELITRRLAARHGHFFPRELVESQFADLEPPQPDEGLFVVSVDHPAPEVVDAIVRHLKER